MTSCVVLIVFVLNSEIILTPSASMTCIILEVVSMVLLKVLVLSSVILLMPKESNTSSIGSSSRVGINVAFSSASREASFWPMLSESGSGAFPLILDTCFSAWAKASLVVEKK